MPAHLAALVLSALLSSTPLSHPASPPAQIAATDEIEAIEDIGEVAVVVPGSANGCLVCHRGIEPVVPPESGMMQALVGMGGVEGTCVVCHGGDAGATEKGAAHRGAPARLAADGFYPAPGSVWIVAKTCGACHPEQVRHSAGSLMATEAGKAQGTLHTFGAQQDQVHRYANYPVDRLPDDQLGGSPAYRVYMAAFEATHPDELPAHMDGLPAPPVEAITADPRKVGFTYLREECQACHVGVRGKARRGDWRGLGCAACHMPFSNEGFSQSGDPTIPRDVPGQVAVHRIRGTRETGGIPTETCTTCHNRGKRIGVSFTGVMETPYPTPYGPGGAEQPKLHGKWYAYVEADHHHDPQNRPENPEGGMLCQDCHTSIDVHGDGRLFGTTLAQVEIECADCHGTPLAYPWELPLGFMDEFEAGAHGAGPAGEGARGVAEKPDAAAVVGTTYPAEQGYLLSARGNPLGNVVRRGEAEVVMHSATGVDLKVPLLRRLAVEGRLREAADTAMRRVERHMERMECYSCHARWAPQCYGCHVKFDYRPGVARQDWIATGLAHAPDGTTPSWRYPERAVPTLAGASEESRTYLRWEDPVLGVNGEGRVTPIYPGCQPVTTVVGPDGNTLVQGKVWESEGLPGSDMAPAQPHTMTRTARPCESCHTDPKAMGYGIDDGRFLRGYPSPRVVDIDVDGAPPERTQPQLFSYERAQDWSQVVTRDGTPVMTVGSHWPLSRALDERERATLEKTGLCLGCHGLMGGDAWRRAAVEGTFDAAGHAHHMRELLRGATGD